MLLDDASPVRVIQEFKSFLYQGECYLLCNTLTSSTNKALWICICFSLSNGRLLQGQLGKKREWKRHYLQQSEKYQTTYKIWEWKSIKPIKKLALPKTVFLFSITYLIYSIKFYFLSQYFLYVPSFSF